MVDFSAIDNHPTDAVRFFKIMMRCEYALKAIGYAEMDRNNRLAVNWTRFTNERLGGIFQRIEDGGKADTLINDPPSHQQIDGGALRFRPAGRVTDATSLVGAIQRVRNNLFHGGKSGEPDHVRNDALIAEAIGVITEILAGHDDLRAEFEGRN